MVIAGIRNERYRRSMDFEKDEVFIERRKVAVLFRNETEEEKSRKWFKLGKKKAIKVYKEQRKKNEKCSTLLHLKFH